MKAAGGVYPSRLKLYGVVTGIAVGADVGAGVVVGSSVASGFGAGVVVRTGVVACIYGLGLGLQLGLGLRVLVFRVRVSVPSNLFRLAGQWRG